MNEPQTQGVEEFARGRLARISHHFLSAEKKASILVLLADHNGRDTLPVDKLACALARLGKTVAVPDPEDDIVRSFHLPAAAAGRRSLRLEPVDVIERLVEYWERPRCPEVFIVSDGVPAAGIATVLIAVPADPPGMRRAYLRLKTFPRGDESPLFGATITGANDCHEAEACFGRFASAARQFLGIDVASYSYIPGVESPGMEQDHQFEIIADLLVEDWRKRAQDKVDVTLSKTTAI